MKALYGLTFAIAALLLGVEVLSAQWGEQFGLHCPGQWVNGGQNCQCPDGSMANGSMSGGSVVMFCPQAAPQYRPPPQYSPPPQPAVGDYCANGRTCPVGSQCTSDGMCMPRGNTECGDHSCRQGSYCGSRNICVAEGATDCGNGTTCSAGKKCSRDNKHCLDQDTLDCGSFFCRLGSKCGSGNKCLDQSAADCGNGSSCSAGTLCRRGGGCATREELAAEAEQKRRELAAKREAERLAEIERQRKAAIVAAERAQQIAAKKKEAEEKKLLEAAQRKAAEEAKKKADDEKREEARLKEQRELQAAKLKEEERKRELAQKKLEAERKAAELKKQEAERLAAALAEAKRKREAAEKLLAEKKELARIEAEAKKILADAKKLDEQQKKLQLKGQTATKKASCETAADQIYDIAFDRPSWAAPCGQNQNPPPTVQGTSAKPGIAVPAPTTQGGVKLNADVKDVKQLSPSDLDPKPVVIKLAKWFPDDDQRKETIALKPPKQGAVLWDKLGRAVNYAFDMSAADPNFQSGAADINKSLAAFGTGAAIGGIQGAKIAMGIKDKFSDISDIYSLSSKIVGGHATEALSDAVVIGRDHLVDKGADMIGLGLSPVSLSSAIKVDASWSTYFAYGFYNNLGSN